MHKHYVIREDVNGMALSRSYKINKLNASPTSYNYSGER